MLSKLSRKILRLFLTPRINMRWAQNLDVAV